MSKILLSIKPEYANKIMSGEKKFEYRKAAPQKKVDTILIYSTKPQGIILGEVHVLNIISGSPTFIWQKTKSYAGITREKYRQYFKGCKIAFAYCLDTPVLFNPSKSLSEFGIHYSPQSYIYIRNL